MKKYIPVSCVLAVAGLAFGAWRATAKHRAMDTNASERDGAYQLREANFKRSMQLQETLQRGDLSPEQAAKIVEELHGLNEVPPRDLAAPPPAAR